VVVYIESCESGSMFNNLLPKNINVYATSASSPDESSWGCYCPLQDKVDGKSIGSCLGDLYSVNWMEDTDKFGMARTLQDQFVAVQKLTTMSRVMQWGDVTFTNMTLGDFQGQTSEVATSVAVEEEEFSGAEPMGYTAQELREMSAVKTYDIPMHLAYYSYLRHDGLNMGENHQLLTTLITELKDRKATDEMFMSLTSKLAGPRAQAVMNARQGAATPNWECLAVAQQAYVVHCGEFTDYSRKYVRVLNNLCALDNMPAGRIESTIAALCPV